MGRNRFEAPRGAPAGRGLDRRSQGRLGGTVNQVSTGSLNASHYKGHDHLETIAPGMQYRMQISCSTDPLAFQKGRLHPHLAIQWRQAGRDGGRQSRNGIRRRGRRRRLVCGASNSGWRIRIDHSSGALADINNPPLDGASVARANGNQDRGR
jgi:hypothetical protein